MTVAKKMVIADLSNIEGRTIAWLAGEEWLLQAFRDFDAGTGHDIYVLAYARSFGITPEAVIENKKTGDGMMRQIGKVQSLALGFGGGAGAFATMAANYGVKLPDEQVGAIVKAWRSAHPNIKRLWYAVEDAARWAIRRPGTTHEVGLLRASCTSDGWLKLRLPSGRHLSYPDARADEDGRVSYMGVNQYTKQWGRIETYGGKLCIAEGTPVLTDRGWVRIEKVTPAHRVWDGVEWVAHKGLANNGFMGVMLAHGVWMTPDHEVLTTEGWVRASQSERFERADARVPDGYQVRRKQRSEIAVGVGMRLRHAKDHTRYRDNEDAKEGRHGVLRVQEARDHKPETLDARYVWAQGVCGLAQYARPMYAAITSSMGAVRRARHSGLPRMACVVRSLLGRYGAYLSRGAYVGEEGQLARLFAGQLRMGYASGASAQHALKCAGEHSVGRNDGSRSGGSRRTEPHDGVLPDFARGAGSSTFGAAVLRAQVYDLVDCGPRCRFVVQGEDGRALIVHNCENATQAVARDVFMHGLRLAEAAGYAVVLRVHDELVCEVPDTDEFTTEGLAALMSTNPSWAIGLPLAAAGHETKRYCKE